MNPCRCSAGIETPCQSGYYNPLINQDTAVGCRQCPLYATGPLAAVNLSQCACANGFVPSYTNGVDVTGGFNCICAAGTEKRGDAAGNVVCGDCESGSYKPDPAGAETVCEACPQPGAVGPLGATHVEQCGCPEDQYKSDADATCEPCPRGAICAAETTPRALNLTAGRWRVGPNSTVVEVCDSDVSCRGGINTSEYCASGHTGPLCAVCSDDYRRSSTGSCMPCSGGGASVDVADVLPMVILLAVLLVGLVLCCMRAYRTYHTAAGIKVNDEASVKRAYREPPKERPQRIISACITKLKIMTAHQQVLQGLAGVFRLTWPPAFKELLSYFKVCMWHLCASERECARKRACECV